MSHGVSQVMTPFTPTVDAIKGRRWWVIDAEGLPLGRLSSHAARLLMGKHKPTWTPFVDDGDFVVVVNCEKVRLTGRKEQRKVYRRHTGYPGGLKEIVAHKQRALKPERLVEEAVQGMLPKNRLGRAMFHKLKVHVGSAHPHAAQAPETLELDLFRAARGHGD